MENYWQNASLWFRVRVSNITTEIVITVSPQNHKESKMVLYEQENFMGHQWEVTDDYPSLQAMGWGNNEIGSMQVQCGA